MSAPKSPKLAKMALVEAAEVTAEVAAEVAARFAARVWAT